MVHWDAVAAIVAMVALPLMLSPPLLRTVSLILRWLISLVWETGATCGRLEWRDIPSGLLHECGQECSAQCTYDQAVHDAQRCLDSTLGNAFPRAWHSSVRREQRVHKPYQLDLNREYVRMDLKTLKAFYVLSRTRKPEFMDEPPIQFLEKEGVLTAHFYVDGTLSAHSKEDINLIMNGYPPYHKSHYQLTNGGLVPSPIHDVRDIARGGWIVATGLGDIDSVVLTHAMLQSLGAGDNLDGRIYPGTLAERAVARVLYRLEDIKAVFPNEPMIQDIMEIVEKILTVDPKYFGSALWPLRRQYPSVFANYEWMVFTYAESLSVAEWKIVLQAFNHHKQLTAAEQAVFAGRLEPILFAVINGLCFTVLYGAHMLWGFSGDVMRMPSFAEARKFKHIYVTACQPIKD